jgi:hypothetical protein
MKKPVFKRGDIVVFKTELLKDTEKLDASSPGWNDEMTELLQKNPIMIVKGQNGEKNLICGPFGKTSSRDDWMYKPTWLIRATPEIKRAVKFELVL